jgi:hypothetical protein
MTNRFLVVFVLAASVFSSAAFAQERFFTSPTRGGADGARQNTQLQQLQNSETGQEGCANSGMIYAPGHPQRDGSNCIAPFRIQNDGTASLTNQVNVPAGTAATPAVGLGATNNGLFSAGAGQVNISAGGTNRVSVGSGGVSITGDLATTGNVFTGAINFSNVPQCPATQKLQWTTGSGWSCAADVTQTGAGTPIGTMINGAMCRSDGSQVICDAAAPGGHAYGTLPVCPANQKLAWNGGAWTCYADTETDPKVGALVANKWCRTNGTQINCDQDKPGEAGCGANYNCGTGNHGDVRNCACSPGWGDCGSRNFQCVNGSWTFISGACASDCSCWVCSGTGSGDSGTGSGDTGTGSGDCGDSGTGDTGDSGSGY